MAARLFCIWIVVSLRIWPPVAQQTGLVSLNDSCLRDSDCSTINGSACLASGPDRKCQCVQGQTNATSRSCRPVRLWDGCKSDADCSASITNAACRWKVCNCLHGYRNTSDGKCALNLVGDSCTKNEDCLGLGGRSKCNNSMKCSCVGEFVERDGGTKCALRELNETCGPLRKCNITNGGCLQVDSKTKICHCDDGFTKKNNTACRKKNIEELSCSNNTYCESKYNNTVCSRECELHSSCLSTSQGSCKCDEKRRYFLVGEECAYVGIGDPCTNDSDCRTENSVCNSSMVCSCNYTHVFSGERKRCLQRRLLEVCGADQECSVENPNSHCSNDSSTCQCFPGFSMEREDNSSLRVCVRRVIGNHHCDVDGDCLAAIPNSTCGRCVDATDGSACKQSVCGQSNNCSARTCLCQRGYISDGGGTKCRPVALFDECRRDIECRVHVPESMCVTDLRTCPCPAGYARLNMTHCEKRDGCTTKDVCENSLIENECPSDVVYKKVCKCLSGYQGNYGGLECKRREIGGDCETREDCTNAVNESDCMNRTCVCNSGYKPGESMLTCERLALGDACSDSTDCQSSVANGVCKEGACACLSGFMQVNSQTCAKRRVGDGNCSIAEDCSDAVKNSHCVDGECQCLSGFSPAGNRTSCLLRKIYSPCQTLEGCNDAVANSYCNVNQCQCNPGYYSSENRTVCIKYTIGAKCKASDQCDWAVNNSNCVLGKLSNETVCMCLSGYQGDPGGSECRRRRVGDQCEADDDCTTAVNDSYCRKGMCVCKSGFRSSYTHSECERRALGDHCDSSSDCTEVLANSTCKESECACLPGFRQHDREMCLRRKIGDGSCITAEDCHHAVNNSQCVEGLCRCLSGFSVEGNYTKCAKRQVGSPCQTPEDCTDAVSNSYCSDGTCQCSLGHYSSKNGTSCRAYRLGDNCTSDKDCTLILHSTCMSSKCNCSKKYDPYNNGTECVLTPVTIGIGTCFFDGQCEKIHRASYCNESTRLCMCREVVAPNKASCLGLPVKLGDTCNEPNHCNRKLANTVCSREKCVCVNHHIPYLNQSGCHPEPSQLGDYCLTDVNCTRVVKMSSCASNNTCVCSDGFSERSPSNCTEKEHLPVYQIVQPEPLIGCINDKCEAWDNSICEKVNNISMCRCDYRHARRPGNTTCVPTQTYVINLHIEKEAGKYDYRPFNYTNLRRAEFETRVTISGIQKIFENSSLMDRYVSSEVVNITNAGLSDSDTTNGVTVNILLHLTAFYLNATKVDYISEIIESNISGDMAKGNLGESLLKFSLPSNYAPVEDYDECALQERNDCSTNAHCLNTLGSFICICKTRFDDVSRNKSLRPGRICDPSKPDQTVSHSEKCSTKNCETKWEYVALALALFVLIIIVFITYEIIQRKQDFSARKLYEKFGTTKIRKLRQASMRRLQASKKKKEEEKKMKKEEAKKKKEEERASKYEEKKVRKESKKFKKGRKSIKKLEEETENKDAEEEGGEIVHPTSLPFADDIVGPDVSGLPGSLNTENMPHMEESPV